MWDDRKALIAQIEQKRGSRLISYLTSDRQNATAIIAKDALPIFFDQLRSMGALTKLDVLIFTTGGDTLAAFGLGRLVREFAPNWVGVLVPDRCFSAGTLFALSANEIYMSRAGTLSPIDPSVTTQLNPVAEGMMPGPRQLLPVSVESVAGFKSLIQDEWGIKNEQMLTSIFKVLAEKVHPLALGDVYRSRQQIERLAHQLLIVHRKDKAKIKKIINTLTRELGSHDYPISRTEARKLMGNQIATEDAVVEDLLVKLFNDYSKEMELHVPFNHAAALAKEKAAGKTPPVRVRQIAAVIESSTSKDAFEQEMLLSEVLAPGPAGPIKALQQEILDAGWKHYS
jgi:ClpP class serine protease